MGKLGLVDPHRGSLEPLWHFDQTLITHPYSLISHDVKYYCKIKLPQLLQIKAMIRCHFITEFVSVCESA